MPITYDQIVTIGSIISPLFTGFLVYRTEKHSRDNKKIQELRAKLEQKERDERRIRDEEIDVKLAKLNEQNERLRTDVTNIAMTLKGVKEDCEDQQTQIDKLSKMSRVTVECIHMTGGVVSALAEGMRDTDVNGNVAKAVAEYRQFESSAIKECFEYSALL